MTDERECDKNGGTVGGLRNSSALCNDERGCQDFMPRVGTTCINLIAQRGAGRDAYIIVKNECSHPELLQELLRPLFYNTFSLTFQVYFSPVKDLGTRRAAQPAFPKPRSCRVWFFPPTTCSQTDPGSVGLASPLGHLTGGEAWLRVCPRLQNDFSVCLAISKS